MSTVCVTGHPAPGHIHPTLPVVAELARRGHRVIYYATEPFRTKIEAAGADFRSYGPHEWFERNLARGGMLGGMAGLLETAEQILPKLLETVAAEDPAFLLVEAHAVWGNLLAQILDKPATTLCSMFAINEALISPRQFIAHLYGNGSREQAMEGMLGLGRYFSIAQRLHERYGTQCPGIVNYLGNRQPLNIVFTSREFQIGGGIFDESYHFAGPPLPAAAEFDPGLPGTDPLLYISLGTMYNDEAAFYRMCFDAFGNRPYRVVMAVGQRVDAASLPEPPANFRVFASVPQFTVLGQANLFLTHGGINSAQESMLQGVPMIVTPLTADHHVVAAQVEAAGAGVILPRSEATAARLLPLAEHMLSDPRWARSAAKMGETLAAAGGAAAAASRILAFHNQPLESLNSALQELC